MKKAICIIVLLMNFIFSYSQDFNKMLFPLCDQSSKLWGCVDIKGNTVIPFKYKDLWGRTFFSSQLEDGSWFARSAYIDEEERFLPYTLGWGWVADANKNTISYYGKQILNYEIKDISSDKYIIIKQNGKFGALDSIGNIVIPCIYDNIILNHENMKLFHDEGLADVLKNDKMGCVDKNGKIVIPCIYDNNILNFARYDGIIHALKDDEEVMLDMKGHVISTKTPTEWIKCPGAEENDNRELICVEKNGKHGCIDKNGKLVIPFISDTHIFFNNNGNYAAISQGGNREKNDFGKFGYINRKGEIVIPCKYYAASKFFGEYAIVETPKNPSNNYEFYLEIINEKGESKYRTHVDIYGYHCLETDFSNEQSKSYDTFSLSSNGFVCEQNTDGGFFFKHVKGYGYEDLENQVFDKLSAFGVFKEGLALVEKNEQKWFVNKYGKNILYDKFDDIGTISIDAVGNIQKTLVLNKRFLISKINDLYGIVDLEREKVVSQCIYETVGRYMGEELGNTYGQNLIHHNMVKVKRNGKYGYVNLDTGEEVIPCEYNSTTARFKKFQYLYNNQKSNIDENIPVCKTSNNKCYAVIIANEKYTREQNVPYALNDGKTFSEYCKKTLGIPNDNIHYAENATLNDIKYHLAWLKNQTKLNGDDTKVIFYYAGHGIPNESDRTSYILPIDVFSFDINTGYSLKDLYKELGNLPAKNIIAFIDACFSGAQRNEQANAEARRVAIKAKPDTPTGKLVVFSASQGDESALPYDKERHGMFTYYLLKKLQETSGNTSLGELTDYVKAEVSKQAFKEKNKIQTPSVYNSSELEDWRNITLK